MKILLHLAHVARNHKMPTDRANILDIIARCRLLSTQENRQVDMQGESSKKAPRPATVSLSLQGSRLQL